jgi:hypothetical protein
MSNFSDKVFQLIKECFGAGGVTCASFAPAVTNTIYPRPGKKKKSKFRKKAEDVIIEIDQEQYKKYLDDLYNDKENDPTEEYWHRPTSADYAVVQQKQNELDKTQQQKDEEEKRARLDKYKSRNDAKLAELNKIYEQWSKEPDVSPLKLHFWYMDAIDKINAAEADRNRYEKMPANELKNIKPIKMKPIPIKFEFFRVRDIQPGEE